MMLGTRKSIVLNSGNLYFFEESRDLDTVELIRGHELAVLAMCCWPVTLDCARGVGVGCFAQPRSGRACMAGAKRAILWPIPLQ